MAAQGDIKFSNLVSNMLYCRFSEIDFDYDRLSEDEKVWCNEDEFDSLLRFINQNRMKLNSFDGQEN